MKNTPTMDLRWVNRIRGHVGFERHLRKGSLVKPVVEKTLQQRWIIQYGDNGNSLFEWRDIPLVIPDDDIAMMPGNYGLADTIEGRPSIWSRSEGESDQPKIVAGTKPLGTDYPTSLRQIDGEKASEKWHKDFWKRAETYRAYQEEQAAVKRAAADKKAKAKTKTKPKRKRKSTR